MRLKAPLAILLMASALALVVGIPYKMAVPHWVPAGYVLGLLRLYGAVALGFLLSGLLLSFRVGPKERPAFAFLVSCLVLYYTIFSLGILGLPLRFPLIIFVLTVIAVLAFSFSGKKMDWALSLNWPSTRLSRLVLFGASALALLFFYKAITHPLMGFDTPWRWNFLALEILETKTFGFYPPLSVDDYRHFFYPSGLPLLTPFAYFWTYSAVGAGIKGLSSIFLYLQFLAVCFVTFRLAETLFGEEAGYLSLLTLMCSPLFLRVMILGQPASFVVLSTTAAVLFATLSRENHYPYRLLLGASVATALALLSRYHGLIALLSGISVLLFRRNHPKHLLFYLLASIALSLPWYARNLYLTGNPVYPLMGALFPVHRVFSQVVHDRVVDIVPLLVRPQFPETCFYVASLAKDVLVESALLLPLGLAGIFLAGKKRLFLAFPIAFAFALWVYSLPYDMAGHVYALRVFGPALPLLAVLSGKTLVSLSKVKTGRVIVGLLLLISFVGASLKAWVYPLPLNARSVKSISLQRFVRSLRPKPPPADPLVEIMETICPEGSRLLTDHMYAMAGLKRSTKVEAVSLWSPEAAFLFEGRPLGEILKELKRLNIAYIHVTKGDVNNPYLAQLSALYAHLDNTKYFMPIFESRALVVYEALCASD